MRIQAKERIYLVAMVFLIHSILQGIAVTEGNEPVVVVTTSVLQSVVEDLVNGEVRVVLIVPPNICPAHYDIRPGDLEIVREASLIFTHGVEPWLQPLLEASRTNASVVVVKGGWNTPDRLKQVYISVANALREHLGLDVEERLKRSLAIIDGIDAYLKEQASVNGFKDTPIVAMKWQEDFLSYLGFRIVASYPPQEAVTPDIYTSVIENATRNSAVLVVDNIHSGVEIGKKIAQEIGAVHVALLNFPRLVPGVNNVTDMMKYNLDQLIRALNNYRSMASSLKLSNEIYVFKTGFYATLGIAIIEAVAIIILVKRRSK
ncbi:MAG: metal ABC transporter substrate-binding protein [Desulfurococcaceae archaeon]